MGAHWGGAWVAPRCRARLASDSCPVLTTFITSCGLVNAIVIPTAKMSFTAPQCRSDRQNVIPSEAEESKPVIGSRGAIHATRHRVEAGCSATA